MIVKNEGIYRHYVVTERQWLDQSGLSDYAYTASLFTDAASRFQSPYYAEVAARIVHTAIQSFYDEEKRIFIDPGLDDSTNVEYLMQLNGLLVESMADLGEGLVPRNREIIEPIITYFSAMGEVLEDRFWNANEWEFTEAYVPYLRTLENY